MSIILKQDHEALRVMMREFAHIMRTSGIEALPDIARKRIAFSQLFREHMGREDARALDLRNGHLAAQADPLLREHGRAIRALFLRYSDHIKYWTPTMIAQDWSGYLEAVLTLQGELAEQMAWEERNLHPLMDAQPRRAA
ncbi:hypothetical protein KRZ98_20745 [Sphingobium sp. AS12]|uniref:hypothetical protein n=1 Tax=Sphingobium sp. AS12 TaxID=2849495 RepID=UPI001C312A15|nr:hypothetical protein [Sphingobium sp. AS12]MBV2150636.1 hypothetical protein [Sphingobium sp. AS12]